MQSDAVHPLAVDLDGTLIRSDLLVEGASAYVTRTPWALPRIARWYVAGRDHLKVEIASRVEIEPATLPYNPEVLAWLEAEHARGRRLVLVSASDERQVRAVADHLGIFEASHGTRLGTNLKSGVKRDLLTAEYGVGGFDYVGNHHHDHDVWANAHTAHVVGSQSVARKAGAFATVGQTFQPAGPGKARLLLKAMRPHQWTKNALIAVPLLAAQLTGDPAAVLKTLLAIVLFSLTASSVYLINDIIDVPSDRVHPTKRNRPFASGQLSLLVGWVTWPLLVLAALGAAVALLPWQFALILAIYFATSLGYAFWAKRKAVLDVIVLGGLYTIRMVAGAAAILTPLTLWLITFSMLFFLSLALIKRVSELTRVRRTQALSRGRGYLDTDLELLSSYGVASSVGAVVIFALYLNDPHTAQLYATPALLGLAIPVLLAWLMRCWLWAHRGDMNEDPIVFAARDPKSILAGVVFVAVFVAANVIRL